MNFTHKVKILSFFILFALLDVSGPHAASINEILDVIKIMKKTSLTGEMKCQFHNYSITPPISKTEQDEEIEKYLKEYEKSLVINDIKSGAHDDPGELPNNDIQRKVAKKREELLKQYAHKDDITFVAKTIFKDDSTRVDHYSLKEDGSGFNQNFEFSYIDYRDVRETFNHLHKVANVDSAQHSVMSKSNTIREYAFWEIDKIIGRPDIKIEESAKKLILKTPDRRYTLDKDKNYVVILYEHFRNGKIDFLAEASGWSVTKDGFWYPHHFQRTQFYNTADASYPTFKSDMNILEYKENIPVQDDIFSIPAGYEIRDARKKDIHAGVKSMEEGLSNDLSKKIPTTQIAYNDKVETKKAEISNQTVQYNGTNRLNHTTEILANLSKTGNGKLKYLIIMFSIALLVVISFIVYKKIYSSKGL